MIYEYGETGLFAYCVRCGTANVDIDASDEKQVRCRCCGEPLIWKEMGKTASLAESTPPSTK